MRKLLLEQLLKIDLVHRFLTSSEKTQTGVITGMGTLGGTGHAIIKYDLLQVNWSIFFTNLGLKLLDVCIAGACTTAVCYLTTRALKKYLPEPKKEEKPNA